MLCFCYRSLPMSFPPHLRPKPAYFLCQFDTPFFYRVAKLPVKTTPHHTYAAPHLTGWQKTLAWPLQIATAIVFLTAGSSKLLGLERMVKLFNDLSSSPELIYLVGGFEIIAAMLLLFPDRAFVGSVMLSLLMGCAVLVHMVLIEGGPLPAFSLLCITATVAWLRYPAKTSHQPPSLRHKHPSPH